MQVIVIASQKGGTGKSTMARHLAVAAGQEAPTVLVDLDPQHTTHGWWERRTAEQPELAEIDTGGVAKAVRQARHRSRYDYVVIDTPPAHDDVRAVEAGLAVADLVIVPVRASPDDLTAVGSTVALVRKHGKPFFFVVTQVVQNSRLATQATTALSQHGPVATSLIGHRVAYPESMIDGRSVLEALPETHKAVRETRALWDYTKTFLHGNTDLRAHG